MDVVPIGNVSTDKVLSHLLLSGLFLSGAGGLEVAVGMHAVNGMGGSVHCIVVPVISGTSRRPLPWPGVCAGVRIIQVRVLGDGDRLSWVRIPMQ